MVDCPYRSGWVVFYLAAPVFQTGAAFFAVLVNHADRIIYRVFHFVSTGEIYEDPSN